MTIGAKIYKFSFLMNDMMAVSSFAETEQQAKARVEKLFGKDETYDLIEFKLSHHVGDYSIAAHKERKKIAVIEETVATEKPHKVVKSKGDLMTNVMDAYAKDKKIDLL